MAFSPGRGISNGSDASYVPDVGPHHREGGSGYRISKSAALVWFSRIFWGNDMTRVTELVTVLPTAMLLVGVAVDVGWAQPRRLDPSGNVREEAYLRLPLSSADQRYGSIDGARMKQLVREVSDVSLANRDDRTRYWGRTAGTRGEEMAREYVERRFRELGLTDIRTQECDLPTQWFPAGYDISVESGGRTYRFDSLVPALRSNPTNGVLDLEAVWVGTGSTADFRGRDVAGKAVFVHSIPAPGSMGHSAGAGWEGAIRRAQELAAAIVVIYGISDNFTVWQSLGGDITTPGAFMGYRDGNTVKELTGRGEPVRVKMRVDIDYRDGLKTASTFGTLPGTTDEEIYVLAHLDGYFEAALDNASGIAVMLTLAEHFAARPLSERRRKVIFVGTAGHHARSPGSRWMHDNRETALTNAALMINCEHVSVKQTVYWGPEMRMTDIPSPRRWWVNGSERLVDLVLDAYHAFGVAVWDHMEDRAAGEMGSVAWDLPSIQIIRSPEIKHTDQDVPAWVPGAGLEAVARAYAKIIDEVNQLDRSALEAERQTDGQ